MRAADALGRLQDKRASAPLTKALLVDQLGYDENQKLASLAQTLIEALNKIDPTWSLSSAALHDLVREFVQRFNKLNGSMVSLGTPRRYRDEEAKYQLQHTVVALEGIVEKHAARMTEADLRLVAGLADAHVIEDSYDCTTGYDRGNFSIGRAGLLRQLCRQELIRRGIRG